MKLRPSITFRLIAHLVPAQILAIAVGWAVLTGLELGGFWSWSVKIDLLATGRTENLLVASLFRGDDGGLRIEPTAALREEMKRVPTLKFAAYDPSRKKIVRGSAAELTPLFVDPPAISLVATTYFFVDDMERLALGVVESESTAFGELRIAIYGERFRWDDPFLLLGDQFTFYWPYIIAGVLLCSAGTWLAVLRGLAPLRNVADEAAKIDIDELNQRLSEGGVPAEILPLVGAFNDTLARLDAGVGRLRRFIANAAHELRTPLAILSVRLGALRSRHSKETSSAICAGLNMLSISSLRRRGWPNGRSRFFGKLIWSRSRSPSRRTPRYSPSSIVVGLNSRRRARPWLFAEVNLRCNP